MEKNFPKKCSRDRLCRYLESGLSPFGALKALAAITDSVAVYDFMHDAFANGQQLKYLTIIDEYTRESALPSMSPGVSGQIGLSKSSHASW